MSALLPPGNMQPILSLGRRRPFPRTLATKEGIRLLFKLK